MAAKWTRGESATPAPANKRTRQNASKKKDPVSDSEEAASPAEVVFTCKPLRPAVPDNEADQERLRANLEKMGCAGLLKVAWHHQEPNWLYEIWTKNDSEFPNSIRANPKKWREDLFESIFGLEADGVALPKWIKGFNVAVSYFKKGADSREGWKFSDCIEEELRHVFEFLTPLCNPMKPARITNKFGATVVANLYHGKKVSWAQVMADVLKQQVELLGPNNPRVCISGYLAPLYAAKEVLNRKERQQYRYTIQGGDPEASDKEEAEEEEEQEEDNTATESDSGAEEEATPEVSGEDRVEGAEPPSRTQAEEQPTGSGQDDQPDNRAGSAGEEQEAQQSQSQAHSAPTEPAGGQEAQGDFSVDPNVDIEIRQWQGLQAHGLQVISGFRANMTLVEQTGFLASLATQVHQEMDFRNKDFEKMAKFLNCAPTPCLITSKDF